MNLALLSPCLSSCKPHGGYYRPDAGEKGLKEMQRFYQQERSRASSTFRKLKAIRRTLTQCAGQIELEPLEDDTPEDTEKDEQEDTRDTERTIQNERAEQHQAHRRS